MTRPSDVEAARVLEFIGASGVAVLLVSVHRRHAFNTALARRLAALHPDARLGTVRALDLIATGGMPIRFLVASLNARGVRTPFGILPGYYLFANGQLLAWDAGLPALEDGDKIAGSLLLGTIWSGLASDLSFIVQAVQLAADESGGTRVAARFADVLARHTARRHDASAAPPQDEIEWACRVLGVTAAAGEREIRSAWKRRRVEHHPDRARDRADFDRRCRISADINRARDVLLARPSAGAAAR